MSDRKVLVTGACGFLGGRLVATLADHPEIRVAGVSRRPPSWATGAPVVIADLSGPSRALSDAMRDTETVVHLAGANEVATRSDPAAAKADTLASASTVLACAAEYGVRRLVYVSTIHVYGAGLSPGRMITETTPPEPTSPYAATRLAVERLFDRHHSRPEILTYRLSNSVGAPVDPEVDRWTLVANDLCRQAVVGGALRLETPGTQWRDFVPLVDVLAILSRSIGASPPAGTYNLASGQPTSVLELAHLVQAAASRLGLPPVSLDAPMTTDPPTEAYRIDVTKLAAAGISSTTPLRDGVEEILRFCAAHRHELTSSP